MGKLLAWREGRSRKHETDIFDIMVFHYSKDDKDFLEDQIDLFARNLGSDVWDLWNEIKLDAKKEAKGSNS